MGDGRAGGTALPRIDGWDHLCRRVQVEVALGLSYDDQSGHLIIMGINFPGGEMWRPHSQYTRQTGYWLPFRRGSEGQGHISLPHVGAQRHVFLKTCFLSFSWDEITRGTVSTPDFSLLFYVVIIFQLAKNRDRMCFSRLATPHQNLIRFSFSPSRKLTRMYFLDKAFSAEINAVKVLQVIGCESF